MSLEVSFHPWAEHELNEAAHYYHTRRSGLGATFLDEVEKAIAQITTNPMAAPMIRGDVRRKLVRRFPYSVLYAVRGETLRILAIANQKRRPFYWYGRK